ncbi:hypothetical protein ADL15_46155 [Actinoplanes awajinensis subsp. mycoplanecinus]|uniref:Nitroreductase n=2 Tax=Actinoplanes awajinensis TaxID=135946 RepID=A0A101JB68_9ACTN|nr:hypothetical protein ADL15_46155 [Actinoplanes awajinensis subsp. mycoplanecinus]
MIGARLGGLAGILGPVDYTAPVRYRRTPALYRRLQPLGVTFVRHGLSPRYAVVLEVPGRRTGVIRRTVLVRVSLDGTDYLVSLAGESEWVRNVRAAGGRATLGRRERRSVRLVPVPEHQRPAVIRAYLDRGGRRARSWGTAAEARHYFGVRPAASPDEVAAVADRYPVFRVVEQLGWTGAASRPAAAQQAASTANG